MLSGATAGRAWRKPVPMVDVLRGALAEVEDYTRVDRAAGRQRLAARPRRRRRHPPARRADRERDRRSPRRRPRSGWAARSSATASRSRSRTAASGMSAEDLAAANEQLRDPPEFRLSSTARLGLYVVGRARRAARHPGRASPTRRTAAPPPSCCCPARLMAEGDTTTARPEPTRQHRPARLAGAGRHRLQDADRSSCGRDRDRRGDPTRRPRRHRPALGPPAAPGPPAPRPTGRRRPTGRPAAGGPDRPAPRGRTDGAGHVAPLLATDGHPSRRLAGRGAGHQPRPPRSPRGRRRYPAAADDGPRVTAAGLPWRQRRSGTGEEPTVPSRDRRAWDGRDLAHARPPRDPDDDAQHDGVVPVGHAAGPHGRGAVAAETPSRPTEAAVPVRPTRRQIHNGAGTEDVSPVELTSTSETPPVDSHRGRMIPRTTEEGG